MAQSTGRIVVSAMNKAFRSAVSLKKQNMMKAIEIIIIPVSDQERAKEYYLKLGFKVVNQAPADHGETWLQMGLPDDSTTIALMSFHGIIMETTNIAKSIKELNEEGIEVGAIDHKPWGKFAWLKDPDGNGLCLHEK